MHDKKRLIEEEHKKQVNAILVPHTHWDREWYSPFQVFRTRLVRMIDNLLTILAHDPKFTCFTLDGQVIPIEDYLEVRPEREAELCRRIKEGRIAIGPFYILPDNFMVSGEAHIRNLLLGMRLAQEYGRVMKVGYIPDAFGQIAQMPQILRGFGIDVAIIMRGIGDEGDHLKSEFTWRAPDGSSVLTHWLVFHYSNLKNVSRNMSTALAYIARVINMLKSKAATDNVLLMNGNDHLEAQPHIPLVVEKANESNLDADVKIGSFSEYFELVKAAKPSLQLYEGEFRGSRFEGVVKGVTSARTYLKQTNAETQTLLEKWVEPFDAWAWSLGERHNCGLIWQAWKYLLQCHPHDSICGCGIDWIHDEMMTRFTSAQQLGGSVLRNDLSLIASKIDVSPEGYAIVVFNPLSWSRTDVVETTILAGKSTERFELIDPEGRPVEFTIIRERTIGWVLTSKIKEKVLDIVFLAEDVPSCGYKTYRVRALAKGKESGSEKGNLNSTLSVREGNSIENEFLKVAVQENGSVTLVDKRSGATYKDFNTLEDGGDVGDEYNYDPPLEDKTFYNMEPEARISLFEEGPARSTLKVEYELALPANASENGKARGSELVSCHVAEYVTLYSKVPRVDFSLEFTNIAKDHRLRVLFPTGIDCDHSWADQAFHIMKRPIALPDGKGWVEPPAPTHALQSFVSVSDEESGVSVATRGLQEYEVKKDGTIAVTLLRCVGWLSREELSTRPGAAGPLIPTPGAQCQGTCIFNFSVIPHTGTWETAKVYQQALQHQAPMRTVQIATHAFAALGEVSTATGEFKEPVVDTTNLSSRSLPLKLSFLSVEPDNILVSAIKRAEDGTGIIVRLYNTTNETVESRLRIHTKAKEVVPVNMRENPWKAVKGGEKIFGANEREISFKAYPFKVNTFKLILPSLYPMRQRKRRQTPREKPAG